jgi:cyclopropane fatty-acyl-phospholipid synthase-like methyltransferase
MSESFFPIDEKGCWITDNPQHCYDEGLNSYLVKFLPNKTVFDFGCGDGNYLKNLKPICSEVKGCDGNPFTEQLTDGIGFQADLSILQDFGKYDWVLSFEVGEHLPKEYESVFIDNLCNHAKKGIIMSWAFPGQPGEGHINCQSSEYIIQEMYKRGFLVDYFASNEMRSISNTWWFQANLLKFYNIND